MSSEDEGTGFVGGLSAGQAQALVALRAALGERIAHPRFTDVLLLRFLRARQFDVGAAGELLERHLGFREKHGLDGPSWGNPHGLGPASRAFPEMPAMKRCYPHAFHKTDRQGRPLYIERLGQLDVPGLLDEASSERILEYFAYESERQTTHRLPACSLACGRLVQSTMSVLDMEGLGFRTATNGTVLKIVRSIMREQEENFPDVTGNLVIVNAPSAFSMVWSLVKPMLSASTAEKIEVFGARNPAYKARLLELVAPESLPEFLGGTCTCAGFEGGCMCSDDGPWRDEAVERTLQETPFWEVLRRLGPQGPSAEPGPPELGDPAPAEAAAHGDAGAAGAAAEAPEPVPGREEPAPTGVAVGGLGGAPEPDAEAAATGRPEEEPSASPHEAAQALRAADPIAEPPGELCSASAGIADAASASTATPSAAPQTREDRSTSAGAASEEPEGTPRASESRSGQAGAAPSSDGAGLAGGGAERPEAAGEGGDQGAGESAERPAAVLPAPADDLSGDAASGTCRSAGAAACLERADGEVPHASAAASPGDDLRGPPPAPPPAADLADRLTADEGAGTEVDTESRTSGDTPQGLFAAASPDSRAPSPGEPQGMEEEQQRLWGTWVLGAGCLSKRADLALGLGREEEPAGDGAEGAASLAGAPLGSARSVESDAEEAEETPSYQSGPRRAVARWLRESAEALGPLISCGPRKAA